VYFKTIEQLMIQSPDAGTGDVGTPTVDYQPHLTEKEQSQLKQMELKYMNIAKNRDMLK
jgi:hypothetical protein